MTLPGEPSLVPSDPQRLAEEAIAAAPDVAWEIALMAGDIERAYELAADGPDAAYQERYIAAWEGDRGGVRGRRGHDRHHPDRRGTPPSHAHAWPTTWATSTTLQRYRRLQRIGHVLCGR